MKLMKLKNLWILLVVLIFACNDTSSDKANNDNGLEVIKIDPTKSDSYVNLSEIADSVICIKLQTGKDDALGYVRRVIVKKKYIYAIDVSQQAMFVFDKTGKFISKLHKIGSGPGEYFMLGRTYIDDNEEYIEVEDGNGNLIRYKNISFDYISKQKSVRLSTESSVRIGDMYYYACSQNVNFINKEESTPGLVIVKNNKIIKVLFDDKIKTENSGYGIGAEENFVQYKNNLYYSERYNNNFYKIEGTDVKPVIKVVFTKNAVDNSIRLEPIKKQIKYTKETLNEASCPFLRINNPEILAFSYFYKEKVTNAIHTKDDARMYMKFKNTNKVYHARGFKNDITDFPDNIYIGAFVQHDQLFENYLIDVVSPFFYFKNKEKKEGSFKSIGNLSEYNNPVVVLVKLKKQLIL